MLSMACLSQMSFDSYDTQFRVDSCVEIQLLEATYLPLASTMLSGSPDMSTLLWNIQSPKESLIRTVEIPL